MNSLFLLIALYTISGKQVTATGEPSGSTSVYEQTHNTSGQMTAGNSIRLTLSGYDGLQLHSITLSMHSNKSAGAGSLSFTVGDESVWSIADAPFSSNEWASGYSKEWVDISHSLDELQVPAGAPLTLLIQASQNSLFIRSVSIDYTPAPAEAYTVQFRTYAQISVPDMQEQQPDAGVRLPDLTTDDPSWVFYGWAEHPVEQSSVAPVVYPAGTLYHPATNCVLHAVYVLPGEQQPWYPTADLGLGDYVIGMYEPVSSTLFHPYGAIYNGMIALDDEIIEADEGWAPMPHVYCESSSIYTLSLSGSELSITHKATATPIRLSSSGKFASSGSAVATWQVQPLEESDEGMPQFEVSAKAYGQTYYVSFKADSGGTLWLCPTPDASRQHNLLFYAVSERVNEATIYSSYAFGQGVTLTPADTCQTYSLPMGACTLMIRGGKKYLKMNN